MYAADKGEEGLVSEDHLPNTLGELTPDRPVRHSIQDVSVSTCLSPESAVRTHQALMNPPQVLIDHVPLDVLVVYLAQGCDNDLCVLRPRETKADGLDHPEV